MQHRAILTATLILILAFNKGSSQVITDTATLRNAINTQIVTNGAQQITAAKLNRILNGTLNVMPFGPATGGVDTVYQRGDSLFFKKNGTEYFGAVTLDSGAYEPPITAPNSPGYYYNGYKQFVPLNGDSIANGASHLFWYNTNANAGWGLNLALNSAGTTFGYTVDSSKVASLANARRISDSAAAAIPVSGKVNYTDTAAMLSPYYRASNPSGYITSSAIAGKVNYTDTAAMLGPYLRSANASSAYYPLSSNPSGYYKASDTAATLLTQANGRRIADSAAAGTGGGSSLPSQSGNSGKYLTTNGTSTAWTSVGKYPYFYVTDYGAVDDSLTDNTSAIQNTIDTAYAHGGGVVYFPYITKGKYLVKGAIQTSDPYGNAITNAQIYLPFSSYPDVSSAPTITLKSDFPPNPYADYDSGYHEATKTVQIISTLGGSNTGSLFGSTYGSSYWGAWNFTQLFIENLTFVVRSVTSSGMDTVATLSALDLSSVEMNNLHNVKVKTQSYLANSVQPLAGTTGIKGPVNLNFNATNWNNVFIQGFDRGMSLSENANVVNSNINACDTGIILNLGYHNVDIGRTIVQWCKVNLSIDSTSIFNITQLDMEDYGGSGISSLTPTKWFDNNYDIYEHDNTGSIGNIHYHMTVAYGLTNEQDVTAQVYSPLISMTIMPDVMSHLPDRNYVNTKPLYATVSNDHVVGLDLSKITFGSPLTGVINPSYSYLKIPSNDGVSVDSTSLSFNTTTGSGLHGTDISSGLGDVRIGSLYPGPVLASGSYATFYGGNTGHSGSAYISAIKFGANIGFITGGGSDTALWVKQSGNVVVPTNNVGIGLGYGVEPTVPLQVAGSVQFNSLNAGGLVFSNAAGLLSNTYPGSGGIATGSTVGLVSTTAQTFGGAKTMQGVITTTSVDVPTTTSGTVGVFRMNGVPIYHSYNSLTNTFVGTSNGNFSLSGSQNTGLGYNNGVSLSSGSFNVFFGSDAGYSVSTGSNNTFLGFEAGIHASDPTSNILIGYNAGQNIYANTNGGGNAGYNIMIGNTSGSTGTYNGSYNVLIGHNALNSPAAIPNNKFCLTGGSSQNNLLYGDFNTGQVQINAASSSPALTAGAALEVVSTTMGVLLPRLTTAQRNAISSPATGLTLYCTDCTATDSTTGVMQTYNGSVWKNNW